MGGEMCIKVYTLEVSEVLDSWDEMHDRDRQIVTLDEAIEIVQSTQKQILLKLKQKILLK